MKESGLRPFIDLFRSDTDLSESEAAACFDALQAEEDEELLACLLNEWIRKGTAANELFSMATMMRSRATKVNSKYETFVDAVGTGGSKAKTFNVSTAAAFVIAGAGLPVAKHGNRAATSSSGSADVLSELGVNISANAARAEESLNNAGICFMFAPKFHSLSPVLGKVRRQLGKPTIFNNLGPLCNPANAPHQIIGVWEKQMVAVTAEVLVRLGTKKSWVVHGEDGLDEITLSGKTFVAEVINSDINKFEISPEDFGIASSSLNAYSRLSPTESAKLVREILSSNLNESAAEKLVLINSAAPIHIAGMADTLPQAYEIASESIRSGSALRKLNDLIRESNK